MKLFLGEEARTQTHQQDFPKTTKCTCGGEARLAFVGMEGRSEVKEGPFVCDLYPNEKDSMWLHDCCAVAIYFCKKCLQPTARYNQA